MKIISIEGSHGALNVNIETGEIISTQYGCGEPCDECGWSKQSTQAYPYILRFDPKTLGESGDINVGYWTKDGDYEPPVEPTYEDR